MPGPAGAKDGEVEVTPAMIEAGLELLFFYERGEDDGGECIREIYVAME